MGGGWSRCAGGVAVEGEPPSDGEELDITQEDETQPLKPAKKAGGEAQSKRWQRGQLLGEGSFGRVLMALDEHSGELQAVKEIPLGPASSPQAEQAASQLQEELRLLQQLRHQNVVDYAGYQRLDHCLCIFLRYVSGGSVASLLSSFGPFPERVLRNYSAQLARGLEFLHHHGVVHRDIKGSNALVTTSGVVKLADFGASKSLDQLVSATSGFKSFRGTPHWMAPEAVRQEGAGRPSDVWSLGCVMIEMATARPPWPESETQMGVLWQIASSSRGPTPPETLSEVGRDMLFQCFKRHPNERITAHQMLAHEYLRHEQVPLDDDALQHTTAELERRASQAYESGDEDGASSTPVLSSGQATGHARNGSATLDLPEIAAEVEESEQKDAETIEKQREWLSELQEDVKREREKQQQNAPGPVTSEVAARLQEVAAHAPIK